MFSRRIKEKLKLLAVSILGVSVIVVSAVFWALQFPSVEVAKVEPTPVMVFEAENAVFKGQTAWGGDIVEQSKNYAPIKTSRGQYVANMGVEGNILTFFINAQNNGIVEIDWLLANVAVNTTQINLVAIIEFKCNGVNLTPNSWILNSTCDGNYYTNWSNLTTKGVPLKQGVNKIELIVKMNSGDSNINAPNIDCIKVKGNGLSEHTCVKKQIKNGNCIENGLASIVCEQCGYVFEEDVVIPPERHNIIDHVCKTCHERVFVFESEDANLSGGYQVENDDRLSGGKALGWLNDTSKVTFNINSTIATKAKISFVFYSSLSINNGNNWVCGDSSITMANIPMTLNGEPLMYSPLNLKGSMTNDYYRLPGILEIEVDLIKGENIVVLSSNINSGVPNFDFIQFTEFSNDSVILSMA